MKKLLTRNLGLKLASLLLAFVLWFLVAQIYDPKDTVTFNNIQVRLINTELLDEEGKVYEVLDNSNLVRVTVTGPQSIVKSELRRSDIVAEADMSKLTDINTIAITYYCENISNDSVEIKGNHDSVRLNVEDKTSKWIKLESNTIGDVASGYMIGNVTLDQTNIEVTGPKSAISQVDHAGVDINVTDSTSSLSANVDIKLYDGDDNELTLESVKKNVDSAHMTVEVLATKEVPVEIEYMGVPEDGYMATGEVESSVPTPAMPTLPTTRTGSARIASGPSVTFVRKKNAKSGTATSSTASRKSRLLVAFARNTTLRSSGTSKMPSRQPASLSCENERLRPSRLVKTTSAQNKPPAS